MVVHKINVQSGGLCLEQWTVDDDEYSYIQLCQDVCSELFGIAFMEREVEIIIKALIQGGKHIIKVDSDRSLMKMFELNTSCEDPIDLFVDIKVVSFVPPDGDRSGSFNGTNYISSDEGDHSKKDDNGEDQQGKGDDEVEFDAEGLVDDDQMEFDVDDEMEFDDEGGRGDDEGGRGDAEGLVNIDVAVMADSDGVGHSKRDKKAHVPL